MIPVNPEAMVKDLEAERDQLRQENELLWKENAKLRSIQEFFGAQGEAKQLRQDVRDLAEALELVLPLAGGYTHTHPYESNQRYVRNARTLLARPSIQNLLESPDPEK